MPPKIYYCSVSGEVIPKARVEFLLESGIPPEEWTTVQHSKVTRVKGLFLQPNDLGEGEVDSSTLLLVTKIHDDSVRSILGAAIAEADPESEEGEAVKEDI